MMAIMKFNRSLILYMAALVCLLMVSGCDDDAGEPSAEEKYLDRLSSTWVLEEVTVDDTDVSFAFPGLELTVNAKKTFAVKNPVNPIWPASGTFTLQPVSASQPYLIKRSDGIDVTVASLSDTNMTLQFPYTGNDGGRVSSVGGIYEFYFTKK